MAVKKSKDTNGNGRRRFLRWGIAVGAALVGLWTFPSLRAWEIGDGPRYRTLHETQSRFNGDIKVVEDEFYRFLIFGKSLQSGQDRRNPNRSAFRYVDGFHLGRAVVPNAKSALFIGLGGGLGPRQFHSFYPKMTVDAVDIDPAVAHIAKTYFKLPQDSRMNVTVGDGRAFLQKSKKKYDLILLDAYDAHSAPPMLTTVEFMRLVKNHLNPGGALVANVIAAQKGPRSRFGRSEYKTLQNVFSDVQVFPIQSVLTDYQTETDHENLIMIARNGGRLPDRREWVRRVRTLRRPEIRELTRIAAHGPIPAWPVGDVSVLTDANPPKEDLFGD
ncbi:MAG: fused MFS/spermidine synthase [Armatimonadetes bacterium]|nr:fused MFS/spermidine synthase [Armatimonadota bacterium]